MMDCLEECDTLAERASLNFERLVQLCFSFLTEQYGYELASTNPYCVEFGKTNLKVSVYHERLSYELYLVFTLRLTDKECFECDMTDILTAFSSNSTTTWSWQASDRENVEAGIIKLAYLLQEYGHEVLVGDVQCFRTIVDAHEQKQGLLKSQEELLRVESEAR
jgi:hypothetical protein